jgi:hypothetical protein
MEGQGTTTTDRLTVCKVRLKQQQVEPSNSIEGRTVAALQHVLA